MDAILKQMMDAYQIPIEQATYLAKLYENFIPEDYLEELKGIDDAISTLSFEEILMQICFLDTYYGQLLPQMTGVAIPPIKLFGCTAIGAKNDDKSVTIGQSLDFGYIFQNTLSFVKYKIFGKRSVFTMKMGAMSLPIGKTRNVYSTLTLVQTLVFGEITMPITIKGCLALENSKNANEFQEFMVSNGFLASWNWIVGDKYGNLIACESIPNCYIEDISNLYAVRTNTYTCEQLRPYLLDPFYSINRQNKAEELCLNAISNDDILSLEEFMDVLRYNDGRDSSISRFPNPLNPTDTATLAFFGVKEGRGYFGLGNPVQKGCGKVPI